MDESLLLMSKMIWVPYLNIFLFLKLHSFQKEQQ